ncbi:MAG: PIG-L deacetylase family protein [Candidatus Kariarchaeaceae archaeon]|jgi:LmbE family N-acetylglucosaminyl deacetylase
MESNSDQKRVLAIFAHADDELSCAGTLANHAQEGHQVTLAFLSKGENSSTVVGSPEEIKQKRREMSRKIEEILGVTVRFLDFDDSKIAYNVENAYKVAEVIKEIQPHILITWNKYNRIGAGHPDHRNCSDLVRDAISYARYKNNNSKFAPYRELFNFYMYHNPDNPRVQLEYVDVTNQEETIRNFIEIYKEAYGNWPVKEFKFGSLAMYGRLAGVKYAEVFEVIARGSSTPKLLPV